ncbi:MAG TPA: glycosyltransferase family 39 protein, partial [Vicinamibacterales bacterium]|nr:glycosyltransferase family 39 protein [Vicinamibacterales bacterium]
AAFLLVGVPWLAFFAVHAIPTIGMVTSYSHDDWLAYQVAAYRIYMHGYWLEGGNLAFDYQPLYRWIAGAIHVVFGDSSAGEIFTDASALLVGALVAFALVKSVAGFKWATAAAAAVLATYAAGTTWHFIGRGLSEIAGAGFGFLAAFFLLRGRLGRQRSLAAAGVFAGLMFYTRLNFLIAGASLVALLLATRTPVFAPALARAALRFRVRLGVAYAALMGLSVALFMTRTWWYTGQFSVLYGTSLKNNDLGLRADTMFDLQVWQRIRHSLASLVFMNEPPQFDSRAVIVALGTIAIALAALQVPVFRRMPASITLVMIGMFASTFFVHTHNYPGRMTIPMVPFACAAAVIGARLVTGQVASKR